MTNNPGSTTVSGTPNITPGSLHDRLQQISQVTHDLGRTLRAQRDLLQTRGITLPADGLDGLQTTYESITRLINTLDQRPGGPDELQQLRALVRNAELVNSTLELDFVLSDVIDTVVGLTGAERGYIVLKDPGSGQLEFRVARDAHQRDLTPGEFTISQAVISQVIQDRQLVVTNDALSDQRFEESHSISAMRLVSILCVPLVRKGVVTGAIYADSRMQNDLFGTSAQALVQAFANQAALAIENARLFESVRSSLAEITAMRDLMGNVFESIASGVITIDAEERIQTINAAAARILSVTAADCVGQPVSQVIPTQDDLLAKATRRVRDQRSEYSFELDTSLPTRASVNLNLRLSPMRAGPQGDAAGVAIVVNDLTAAKRHHAQISVLARYLPPALVDNIEVYDRAQLGGDERVVSVLSCDIRGFSSFSENLDPQQLMRIINIYLTISSDAIHLGGGIIDKYMGDAVVGLFNTQINPEADHAVRAVRTALLMARDVQARHETLLPDERLFFGMGVHTGNAVLGNVGSETRKEFTAIGDTVQFAKLLQENALKGEVLISQQTCDLVADYFEVERLAPRKQKERYDFDAMYRVIGIKAR
ncbi:MAG: GAF domain-containing protein [Aggregatilineales bacterium]